MNGLHWKRNQGAKRRKRSFFPPSCKMEGSHLFTAQSWALALGLLHLDSLSFLPSVCPLFRSHLFAHWLPYRGDEMHPTLALGSNSLIPNIPASLLDQADHSPVRCSRRADLGHVETLRRVFGCDIASLQSAPAYAVTAFGYAPFALPILRTELWFLIPRWNYFPLKMCYPSASRGFLLPKWNKRSS